MKLCSFFFFLFLSLFGRAQTDSFLLVKPDRVFDGEAMHEGWAVLVKNQRIEKVAAYPFALPVGTQVLHLEGTTLMPGLIEGHAHLFLHPYNELPWADQVLKESRAERTARAVVHARNTLMAGFTTVRDLGTEGAAYDDVGLKRAIEKGIIPGPRLLVATRAIVAKGSYAPKSENSDVDLPQGAEEAGNAEELSTIIRTQMSKGADLIKVYADYRYGTQGEARPAFTAEEWKVIGELPALGGRKVVAHASTPEGMRQAALARVSTIEHGDEGTPEVFQLMKTNGVALCPTLAAGEAITQYGGWRKGRDAEPERILRKRKSFAAALQAGVAICFGGDVGVFAHGDNAREMELMVAYGMTPLAVLQSATSVNADVFGLGNEVGRLKTALWADMVAVQGNPLADIARMRQIVLVMKGGAVYLHKK